MPWRGRSSSYAGSPASAARTRALSLPRVVPLDELWAAGVTRAERLGHVAAGRWRDVPGRGVVLDTGPVVVHDRWSLQLVQVGPSARLGGVTALQAVGLTGFVELLTHIWVPKGAEKSRPTSPDVRLHETRRWSVDRDATMSPVPRSVPVVATVQGALWARTLTQGALVLAMAVQQRLVRAADVRERLELVRRHPYRRLLLLVLGDIADGSHSMPELDFLRLCRAHGMPDPDRQVERLRQDGRRYLDARWGAYGLVVEVNGLGHERLDRVVADDIRMVALRADGDEAVQVTSTTLRLEPAAFFEAFTRLLRARGWTP